MMLLAFAIFTLHTHQNTVNGRLWLICSYIMVVLSTTLISFNFTVASHRLSTLRQVLIDGPVSSVFLSGCNSDPALDGSAAATAEYAVFAVNV